jgi:hypothetical protein
MEYARLAIRINTLCTAPLPPGMKIQGEDRVGRVEQYYLGEENFRTENANPLRAALANRRAPGVIAQCHLGVAFGDDVVFHKEPVVLIDDVAFHGKR